MKYIQATLLEHILAEQSSKLEYVTLTNYTSDDLHTFILHLIRVLCFSLCIDPNWAFADSKVVPKHSHPSIF